LDAVYSTSNPLHLSALLKAVRTTYNIFLLSRNNDNQNVAQITMTQMVDHIFRRVKSNPNVQATPKEDNEFIQKEDQTEEKEERETARALKDGDENKDEIEENNTENNNNNTVSNAPHETDEDSAAYQQQIIVEANMARTEMDHKLPSGKSKDNYEDFLNDTANVFREENKAASSTINNNHLATVPTYETT
jgi:brefeldin A-inhibited guanine nucleotide-exchange protein